VCPLVLQKCTNHCAQLSTPMEPAQVETEVAAKVEATGVSGAGVRPMDRFELLRRSNYLEVVLGEAFDYNGNTLGLFCQLDKVTGWPKYSVNEGSGPLPDGICKIKETAERGISLRQLLVTYEYSKRRCVAEGWASWDGKPLTPETVTLYDLCKYVIKPSTEAHQCSFVELVTSVGEESVRRCPDGHVPMTRTQVYARSSEGIPCMQCANKLKKGAIYWICHRCGDKHVLCDACAPAPAPVPRAELQRPLWFVSHWYGPRHFVPLLRRRERMRRVQTGGASPSSGSSRASCSTRATGTTSRVTTTRGSISCTGCAHTRTTSMSTPPSVTGAPCGS
jgi:hypothetical protein